MHLDSFFVGAERSNSVEKRMRSTLYKVKNKS